MHIGLDFVMPFKPAEAKQTQKTYLAQTKIGPPSYRLCATAGHRGDTVAELTPDITREDIGGATTTAALGANNHGHVTNARTIDGQKITGTKNHGHVINLTPLHNCDHYCDRPPRRVHLPWDKRQKAAASYHDHISCHARSTPASDQKRSSKLWWRKFNHTRKYQTGQVRLYRNAHREP